MNEPELFTEPMPTAQPLPHRQDIVMRALIRLNGLTEDEAGALLHADRPRTHRYWHSADDRCIYCPTDGRSVLKALRNKKGGPLVTRRKDGTWTLPGEQAKQEHERARAAAEPGTAPPARSWSRGTDIDDHGFPKGF